MNNIDLKNLKVAKRYANALLESCSDNDDICNEISTNLDDINETFKNNADFRMFFKHPVVSLKDKKETLEEIFKDKINPKTLDFLYVLLEENRFNILNTINQIFQKDVKSKKNQQETTVLSAIELDDNDKEKLKEKLSKKLNKQIILTCQKQEDILGGLIIKINDKVIDLSLKTKFDNLRKHN